MAAQIIEQAGKKEFAVIPYNQYVKIQEALEDYHALKALRGAKRDSKNQKVGDRGQENILAHHSRLVSLETFIGVLMSARGLRSSREKNRGQMVSVRESRHLGGAEFDWPSHRRMVISPSMTTAQLPSAIGAFREPRLHRTNALIETRRIIFRAD